MTKQKTDKYDFKLKQKAKDKSYLITKNKFEEILAKIVEINKEEAESVENLKKMSNDIIAGFLKEKQLTKYYKKYDSRNEEGVYYIATQLTNYLYKYYDNDEKEEYYKIHKGLKKYLTNIYSKGRKL